MKHDYKDPFITDMKIFSTIIIMLGIFMLFVSAAIISCHSFGYTAASIVLLGIAGIVSGSCLLIKFIREEKRMVRIFKSYFED